MPDLVAQVSRHLHAVQTLQEMALDAKLLPLIQGVQAWQTLRMQSTHHAHMNNPNTAPALAFFVEQLGLIVLDITHRSLVKSLLLFWE